MADISKITLPSGDSYDLKDSFVRNKTIEYIVGTQTAKTGSWTGNTADSALYVGKTIAYKLPYAGSGNASLTLTLADGVTTTGAIAVYANTTRVTTHYGANSVILMTYDGTYWRTTEYWVSNTNTIPSAYGEVAAGTAAKTASCSNFSLAANSYLHFDLRYANTVAGPITMNVNSTGAKPIYINGEASSAANYTLPAGSYLAFYDGTAWQFRTDGKIPGGGVVGDAGTVNGHTVQSDVPANAKFTDTTYTASNSNPLADGTASPGSSAEYARGDHVHPTDTSRAPLASPALTGTPTAPTATAGTSSTQIATTAFVGTAIANAKPSTTTATVTTSAWSNLSATVNVTGVTANNTVLVAPAPSSRAVATAANMYCSAQGAGTLTFTCTRTPTSDVTVNVVILK